MAKKLIADLMVDYLERRDVKYVFGLCGHTVIAMLDALSRSKKVKYISNRHESVASTAADGYARVTHKASVVLCHLGPGLTNVLTGVANAAFDSIPMVVIAGDVPSYYFGKHPHQEVNMHEDGSQYKILEPVVKRAWRVDDPESMAEIMDKAFRLAESGRPGPVLIDVPMNIFSCEVEDYIWDRTYRDSHITMKPALDPEAAKAIAKKLVEAKNPVLHAGGGILLAQASDELAALAEFPYPDGTGLHQRYPSSDDRTDRFLGHGIHPFPDFQSRCNPGTGDSVCRSRQFFLVSGCDFRSRPYGIPADRHRSQ